MAVSAAGAPRRTSLARLVWADLRALSQFTPLVRALTSSSLRTENVGTILGYVWWLLHPLLLMAAYLVLVQMMLRSGENYFPLFLLTSVLCWKYFSAGTRNAIAMTLMREAQMRQVAFPKIVLPLSSILAETVRFAFGVVVLILAAAAYGLFPTAATPFLFVVAGAQLVLTLAFAIFFSALNFFFRDVGNIVSYSFPIWFYLSPSLYSLDRVPEQYLQIYMLNPFATIMPAYRTVLIDQTLPDLSALGIVFGASVALLAFAYVFFVRLQSAFAKVN